MYEYSFPVYPTQSNREHQRHLITICELNLIPPIYVDPN